jgi:hypothetical protein
MLTHKSTFLSDTNMIDPLYAQRSLSPPPMAPVASTSAPHIQSRTFRAQPRPALNAPAPPSTMTQAMMSSQATLVATQITGRVTRERARDAVVRAQASPTHASGSGASQRVTSGRVSNVVLARAIVAAPRQPESPAPFRNTRARSKSVEHSLPGGVKKLAKGRKHVLDPVTEDQNAIEERGNERDQLVEVEDIEPPAVYFSQAGPMAVGRGETNNEEEEVDQLLDEEPSGTVDLNVGDDPFMHLSDDDVEQEPADDAQVRVALENPDGSTAQGEEDESVDESDSEDELAQLQNLTTAQGQPNPGTNNTSGSTERRYKPLSHTQNNLPFASISSTRRQTPAHNPLLVHKPFKARSPVPGDDRRFSL